MTFLIDAHASGPRLMARLGTGLCFAFAMLAITAAARPAQAQRGDSRARELYLEGDRHYAAGRYEDAVQAFEEAYQLSERPLLLFNLANAYERLGRYEEALSALSEYAPHAAEEEQEQIRSRIENLTRRVEEQASVEEVPDGEPDGSVEPPPDEGGDDTLILTGAVLAGVGGALVLGGAIFGGLALAARDEANAGCVNTGGATVCDDSVSGALSRDRTFAALADVGLFGGLAVAGAGAVLIVLGLMSDDEEEPAETVTPTVGLTPSGGEVGLVGSF